MSAVGGQQIKTANSPLLLFKTPTERQISASRRRLRDRGDHMGRDDQGAPFDVKTGQVGRQPSPQEHMMQRGGGEALFPEVSIVRKHTALAQTPSPTAHTLPNPHRQTTLQTLFETECLSRCRRE